MKIKFVSFVILAIFALSVFAYDFLILSDTHYDSADLRVSAKLTPSQTKEKSRNLTAWEKTMPVLLQAMGKASENNVDFVLHLGDLTQGDFGSGEMHAKALTQAKAKVGEHLKCPLYMVKGNHDIRGVGAYAECQKFFTSCVADWTAERKAKGLSDIFRQAKGVSFAFMHKGDLFICCDSISPDIAFLREVLIKHPEAKHVFFCTHLPVLPCSYGYPYWIVFGKQNAPQARQELLALLASRDAIVLCGHIHRTTMEIAEFEKGRIRQFTIFSQPSPKDLEPRTYMETDILKDFCEHKKVLDSKQFQTMSADYLPHIKKFVSYSLHAGFAKISVNGDDVTVTYFQPDGSKYE